jgi:putative transposase
MILNEAKQIERSRAIGAGPYERFEGRNGYANGFKDKSVKSRLGLLPLRIPQVRGDVEF